MGKAVDRVATFEKVSEKQFLTDWMGTFPAASREQVLQIYADIRLPSRATRGSAGYDFFSPDAFTLEAGQEIKLPTGIRVHIREGWVLSLFPRSGLGFKYRLQLNNTVGIIDSDYAGSDNEGHIFAKLTNDSREKKQLVLQRGDGFIQGIFLPFGVTEDDHADAVRNGGFGSTGKKEV